jgi:hypothetical protein
VFGAVEPGVSVISPDGKHIVRLSPETVPDLQHATVLDFAPGPQGETYLLASMQEKRGGPIENYAIKFDNEGKHSAAARLDLGRRPGFVAKQIGVFGSGDLLIAGYEHGSSRPVTAIFAADGQLVREISLAGDLEAKVGQRALDSAAARSVEEELTSTLDLTSIQLVDNGNLVLMRPSPGGPVYIVSPGGEVRRLVLNPPPHATLVSARMAGGTLAAQYLLPKSSSTLPRSQVLVLISLDTGAPIEQYESTDISIGDALMCYDKKSFTFLTLRPNSGLQLVRAVPE